VIAQAGEAGGRDIAAWAVAGEVARRAATSGPQMRYALRFSAASGDPDRTDDALNGFDPLFPNPTYTGSIPLVSPTNTLAINPRVAATWPSNLRLSGDVAIIHRLEAMDTVYGFSGIAIPTAADASDDVGALWSMNLSRPITRRWSASTTVSYFDAGDYFAGVAEADTRFATLDLTYSY
jgi:Alginate export